MAKNPAEFPAPFRRALLAWYRTNARPLPWREAPSPYKTIVSEFMLLQTQVKTVLPYFARWMDAFPDFATLAAAPESRVLKLWEGLGYYSRVRNLHRLARECAARPALPRSRDEWLELPGVGPYTAAAISSIAFGEPAACVDGNVVRILARLTADTTSHRDSVSAARAHAPLATVLLHPRHPGDHNQAMMELGATVCLRHNPACPRCPVRTFCAAAQRGTPTSYPILAPKKTERRHVIRVWCERPGALLLHRTPAGARRLATLHELPTAAQAGIDEDVLTATPPLATRRRSITRFLITESIHAAPSPSRTSLPPDLVWAPLDSITGLTLSGPHRRWVEEILRQRTP